MSLRWRWAAFRVSSSRTLLQTALGCPPDPRAELGLLLHASRTDSPHQCLRHDAERLTSAMGHPPPFNPAGTEERWDNLSLPTNALIF